MNERVESLSHLEAMRDLMDDESLSTETDQAADVSEQIQAMALSMVGYAVNTKMSLEAYREDTKALQARLSSTMEEIEADLQQGCALYEPLFADAQALMRAQERISQVVSQHQAVYDYLNSGCSERISETIKQSTPTLGK